MNARHRACLGVPLLLIVMTALVPVAAAGTYACEPDLIEILFAPDRDFRLRGGVPVDLATGAPADAVGLASRAGPQRWEALCPVAEERLDAIHDRGEALSGRPLYNLNNACRLRLAVRVDLWALCDELEALPEILRAYPVPRPQPLPVPDDYEYLQGYLRPASATPTGVNADWAWTQPGGDGSGVTVCDLEYSWNFLHNDLVDPTFTDMNLWTSDPQGDDNHGTAVAGVLGSHPNSVGTTGICHGATLRACGTFYGYSNPEWNVPGAIGVAVSYLSAGDVILIEHQWDYTGAGGYVPIEWWGSASPGPQGYNGVIIAIENAIANRIHVVECAGNGGIDLDGLSWYGDSGAIIAGAGGVYPGGAWSEGDLQRLSFSCYGQRVDLQGWGEDVATTGYGTYYDDDGVNDYYTVTFDGTSSAGPVVAGAVGCCMGHWRAAVSSTVMPPPRYLRDVLKTTGTPQVTPPAGNIGPRPDLAAAFPRLQEWADATAAPLTSSWSSGALSWGDYDGDGDLDLYLTHSPYTANMLLRNDGGGAFTDVADALLGDLNGYAGGAAWGDYDNDGDLDMYRGSSGGSYNKLLRNDGGVFVDATSGWLGSPQLGSGPTWVDYDNDGDLDLYVTHYTGTNRLLRNDGGGVFEDATTAPIGDAGNTTCAAWADYDLDGDLDVYLVDAYAANKLLRNDGGGAFSDVTAPPLGDAAQGTAAVWGDYDNDGDPDLYLVNGNYGGANKLLRNDGGGAFADATAGPEGEAGHSRAAAWCDCDNDGDLDLYLTRSSQDNILLRNDGGAFTAATHGLLADAGQGAGLAWGDYDGDGRVDLIHARTNGCSQLCRNQSVAGNHWLQVRLVGVASNACGIGARVRVVTSRGAQVRTIASAGTNTLLAEFGLGTETDVDSLIVHWPSGTVQDSLLVAADQLVVITESTSTGAGDDGAPTATRLLAAWPNPFNPATRVAFDLARPGRARLSIHDAAGRLVRVLADEDLPAGRHERAWDGRDGTGRPLASGLYLCRLVTPGHASAQRLLLLK